MITFLAGILWYFSLPDPLFDVTYSTVIEDRNGELLGARIAEDEQWRFHLETELPERYKTAVLHYEDRRFMRHPGVDPLAFGRAFIQNVRARRVVSGGSTISMQVIRLSGENPPRTPARKALEMMQATRLEWAYSKDEILMMYASHAPFGGNVVGYDAASWRYFGRPADELSWAESALLAVLPNSPSLMHPGRNRQALQQKRDRLLNSLHEAGYIDDLTLDLALGEPVPQAPKPVPGLSPHLLDRVYSGPDRGKKLRTTIHSDLQRRASEVVSRYYGSYRQNEVHNIAAVIAEVKTGKVLAYIGNSPGDTRSSGRGHQVDIVQSRRSTGSLLKPMLYALMLDRGELLPHTLVADVPTQISDYAPQNFSRTYSGAVPASEVISRSLNVPSVRMLQQFGLSEFHNWLQLLGMSTIDRPAGHYGLTLILGGAEGTLWELTGMYASLARHLQIRDAATPESLRYRFQPLQYVQGDEAARAESGSLPLLSQAAVWAMLEAMSEVKRPDGEVDWRRFDSARRLAWKTGTSYGHRDAWSVGVTPEYVIGVWVGNAGGEGRPGLTGVQKAAPVMFDLFNLMEPTSWFTEPVYQTKTVEICTKSGHRAGPDCESTELQSIPETGLETNICPYHSRIHTDASQQFRLSSRCASAGEMHAVSWFELPPAMAWYYRKFHSSYRGLPDWAPGCAPEEAAGGAIALLYPLHDADIYIPLELDGSRGRAVLEAAHQKADTRIYWHLNGDWIGTTQGEHQLAVAPPPGTYKLTLVDEHGSTFERGIRILEP